MASILLYTLMAVAVASAELALFPLRPLRRQWAVLLLLAALGGAAAVLLWPPPAERWARGKRLVDVALPRYQFSERHQTRICAPGGRIEAAVRNVTPEEIRWLGLLGLLRGLQAGGDGRSILEIATTSNFVLLADTPEELVLGIGGEFWSYSSTAADVRQPLQSTAGDPAAFATLDLGGRPKAVINFVLGPAPFGCRTVTTETRIDPGSPGMQRKFAAYWRAIQPGSALLRRMWLDAIRRRAEGK